MVKPYFQNLEIECWQHVGKLGTAEPSLCLFHASLKAGEPLLSALNELEDDEVPSNRSITFKSCQRDRSFSTLRLKLLPGNADLRVMRISCASTAASIEMTMAGLNLLRRAVTTWLEGGEDFGVSPNKSGMKKRELGSQDLESGELWFWGPVDVGP